LARVTTNLSGFVHALRVRSRLALYLGLAVTGAAAFLGLRWIDRISTHEKQWMPWVEKDYAQFPAVQRLQRYIQIDTSQPDADELSGALFLKTELEAAGIPVTLEDLGNRKANLWAILEGESPEAIVLHSHIDTDPIGDPTLWDYPPLGGTVAGPSIWGRGSFDMKSVAIAHLEAMLALKRSGRKLGRSVIFLATGSEEVGSELGMQRILAVHPELAKRFWAVLTEGGVVETWDSQHIKYWGTEIAQVRSIEIHYRGKVETLTAFRDAILARGLRARPRVVPEVRAFLTAWAPTRDWQGLRALLFDPDRLIADPARMAEVPPLVQELFFDRVYFGAMETLADGTGHLPVQGLLLPGRGTSELLAELLPERLSGGLDRTIREGDVAVAGSPTDHPAYAAITAVLRRNHPGVSVGPYVVTRSRTDARFLRAQGTPAYGFSPFALVTSDTLRVGAANEHIQVVLFANGIENLTSILGELTDSAPK
jgi:acetylornithine deacetylase/succinyl-diaminopimelate desuccinylase-like protein